MQGDILWSILIYYTIALKYANRATQEVMTLKVTQHIKETLVADMMTQRNPSHRGQDISDIEMGRTMAKSVLDFFAPKSAVSHHGQYDASNLKQIMINSRIFDGWVDHKGLTGWLQTFQKVSKMRNEQIGHNNTLRLSQELRDEYYGAIMDLFEQLNKFKIDIDDQGKPDKISQCEAEIEKLRKNYSTSSRESSVIRPLSIQSDEYVPILPTPPAQINQKPVFTLGDIKRPSQWQKQHDKQ